MSLGSREMVHLLCNLSDLIVHHLLVSSHRVKLGVQLVDRLTKCLIGLRLSSYKALHEALQIGLGLLGRLLRRLGIRGPILETGRLWL